MCKKKLTDFIVLFFSKVLIDHLPMDREIQVGLHQHLTKMMGILYSVAVN